MTIEESLIIPAGIVLDVRLINTIVLGEKFIKNFEEFYDQFETRRTLRKLRNRCALNGLKQASNQERIKSTYSENLLTRNLFLENSLFCALCKLVSVAALNMRISD